MIRDIVAATDPLLRKKSKPIRQTDKKVISLINDLKNTLVAQKNPEGVGLAAPQIGKNVRVFVIKPKDKIKTFINPEILSVPKVKAKKKKTSKVMEGCLSIPHYYGPLKRPQAIKVKYKNIQGNTVIKTYKGLSAQIIQHEIDHLEGILFTDHLLKQKQKLYEYVNGEWEEINLII